MSCYHYDFLAHAFVQSLLHLRRGLILHFLTLRVKASLFNYKLVPQHLCTGLQLLLAGEWSAQKLSPIPVPESLQVDTKISNEVKD